MWKELRLAHYLGRGGEKNRTPLIHEPRQLRMLAKSKDAGIRFAVARSSCVTSEILWLLVQDSSWPVRMAVAVSFAATEEMLLILLTDMEIPVREAAIRTQLFQSINKVPLEIALRLSRDPSNVVREHFFASKAFTYCKLSLYAACH